MLFYYFDAYVAVIGDIVKSRKLEERAQIQDKLKYLLAEINDKYKADLASDFMITLGDEFQGLLRYGGHTLQILSEIETGMEPVRLRFGLGIGQIKTAIDPKFPLGADGPAYHNARKMIDQLKANEKKYETAAANIRIATGQDTDEIDDLLNSLFSLCTILKSKWTPRQKEIISCYLQTEKNQHKTAEKLGIKQSNVNRALKSAGFYSYLEARRAADRILRGVETCKHV